jgi:RNA polymerase sigma-70 factor (ECF subfamily)
VDDPTDADLIAAHTAGDPEAFGVLFGRHKDRMWSVALRTLRDPEEAADAVQDAALSAFRRADTFRGDAAVMTWLHRIVVNACLDRIRRRNSRPVDLVSDDRILEVLSAPGPDETERHQTGLDVRQALATLGADQRAALMLVDMAGYSIDDAAAILGCAPGTVKSRCARGRARLVPLLGNQPAGTDVQPGMSTAPVPPGPGGLA